MTAFLTFLATVSIVAILTALVPIMTWSLFFFLMPLWAVQAFFLHRRLRNDQTNAKAQKSNGDPEIRQLYARLNSLTYDWQVSQRLVDQAATDHPGKGHKWYIEKAIADLERDRW